MILSKLYVHVKKGTAFKPGSLVGDCAVRADYVTLPNGDAVGVVHGTRAKARQILESTSGVTCAPPLHRPIQADHITAFAHAGAAAGDTTYDLGVKLYDTHKMPWFHPENGPDY